MTEITEKLADHTMSEIVARVARGLESAAAEYGPDAVDLAMSVYQLYSIQQLAIGAILIFGVYVIYYVWFDLVIDGIRSDWAAVALTVIALIGSVFNLIAALNRLLFIPHWLSAFGHPEVLIATTALKAAGLMP